MKDSPKTVLLVFMKYPEPGKVKTRLAAKIGDEPAAAVYRIFAETCLHNYQQAPQTHCIVYYAPAQERERFVQWLGKGVAYLAQPEGDLGTKLRAGFQYALRMGCHAIALGTDSPDLPTDYIQAATEALQRDPVVVGPSEDGGYYLIGMNGDYTALFQDIAWSTENVFTQTLEKAKAQNLTTAILPQWYDVDTESELRRVMKGGGKLATALNDVLSKPAT